MPARSDRMAEPNFNDTIAAFLEVAQDSSANLSQDLVSVLDESNKEQLLLLSPNPPREGVWLAS